MAKVDETFRDRVVVITGAAGGFGRRLVAQLLEAGANLVVGDRDSGGLRELAERHVEADERLQTCVCDVTVEAQVAALVERAVSTYGRIDIAVNNAGFSAPMMAFVDTTERDLDLGFAVNAKGVFFGMKHQIRQMLAQQDGGVILNVASKAGVGGAPKLAAYAAAKHAVVGLTKTAALEYASRNIRINAICPYYSPTPMVVDGISETVQVQLASRSPMKRLGTPEEMVAVMLMLISPAAGYLTGQTVVVDGGMAAG